MHTDDGVDPATRLVVPDDMNTVACRHGPTKTHGPRGSGRPGGVTGITWPEDVRLCAAPRAGRSLKEHEPHNHQRNRSPKEGPS
jgi:hypothetical protein